ncbi:dihydrofolate reductase [bacterium]|nr:dihydrofolate reductase [bacterium]
MNITAVVAMAHNQVIGKNGGLPWDKIQADRLHFSTLTKGGIVIMGRKTHESIGKPLKDRDNIVMTTNQDYEAPGCMVVHSVNEMIAGFQSLRDVHIFCIGGEQIYSLLMPWIGVIYVTRVIGTFAGDTHFPLTDRAWSTEWQLATAKNHIAGKESPYDLTFEIWKKKLQPSLL